MARVPGSLFGLRVHGPDAEGGQGGLLHDQGDERERDTQPHQLRPTE